MWLCYKERIEKGPHRNRNEAVLNLWKNFAEELKEDLVVPMSLMMCKKCFSAFERYHTLSHTDNQ